MRSWFRLSILVALAAAAVGVTSNAALAQDDEGGGLTVARSSAQVPDSYEVQQGDTLWGITDRFYGNPYEWPRVWSYNPSVTNPNWIYPDTVLRLRPGSGAVAAPVAGAPAQIAQAAPLRQARQPKGIWLQREAFLDKDALKSAGSIGGAPNDHMFLYPGDLIYIEYDKHATPPKIDQEYSIFRVLKKGDYYRRKEAEGTLVRIYGTAKIVTYDAKTRVARAKVVDSLDPIERGFQVAAVPRHFDDVERRPNAKNVKGEIIADLRPLGLIGQHMIVFVNRGSNDGVEVGNTFDLVRSGDPWRDSRMDKTQDLGQTVGTRRLPKLSHYPTEVIGQARVVDVRPKTATLYVTESTTDMPLGVRAEMRAGQ